MVELYRVPRYNSSRLLRLRLFAFSASCFKPLQAAGAAFLNSAVASCRRTWSRKSSSTLLVHDLQTLSLPRSALSSTLEALHVENGMGAIGRRQDRSTQRRHQVPPTHRQSTLYVEGEKDSGSHK